MASSPVPLRLRLAEERLQGSILTEKVIQEVQTLSEESVLPITDIRSSDNYRRQIVGVFVKRGLARALGWSQP